MFPRIKDKSFPVHWKYTIFYVIFGSRLSFVRLTSPQRYSEILYLHPCLSSLSLYTHARIVGMRVHARAKYAPGFIGIVLLVLAFFFAGRGILYPSSCLLVHCSSPQKHARKLPKLGSSAIVSLTHLRDGLASVCVSISLFLLLFFLPLFFLLLFLFYEGVFPVLSV